MQSAMRTITLGAAVLALGCEEATLDVPPEARLSAHFDAPSSRSQRREGLNPAMVAEGRQIFRYEDFEDSRFWTDTLRLHELVQGVDPATALSLWPRK